MKLYAISVVLMAALLGANWAVPTVARVTFAPDTTLAQVVDLLDEYNTWAAGDNFRIDERGGFFYFKGGMSVAEREQAIWRVELAMAEVDKREADPAIVACVAAQNCGPVMVSGIKLLNPPAGLLASPLVAAENSSRELHPFFRQLLLPGRPLAP